MTVAENGLEAGDPAKNPETDPSLSKDDTKPQQWTPPTDGSWVPRERLNTLMAKNADLQKELQDQKEANIPPPVPRSEMLQKVDAGEITQAEADIFWEDQITSKVTADVKAVVQDTANMSRLQDELAQYENTVPALSDETSEIYVKVAKEYQHFTQNLGMPNTTSSMLAALRSVVGPVNSLKLVDIKNATNETHQEFSNAGESGNNPAPDGKSKLTERQKEHYSNAIRQGAYKNWDAVHAELKAYNS